MPLTVERGQTLYRVRFDENTVTEATPYGEVVFFEHDGVPYAIACEGPGAGEGDLPELYVCSGEDLAIDDGFTDNELIVDEDGGDGGDGEGGEGVATPVTPGDSEDPEDPEDDEDEYNEDEYDEDEDEDSEDEDAEDGPAPAAAD